MSRTPKPVSVLVIGDSWSSNPALEPNVWAAQASLTQAISIQNLAVTANCLFDPAGPNGAATLAASIDSYLASSPNSDIVVITTCGTNDIQRRAQGDNAVTSANLEGAAKSVLDKIFAAKKDCIVTIPPFLSSMVVGLGGNLEADCIAANSVWTTFRQYLRTYSAFLGFVFHDPRWCYNFTDIYDFQAATNGLKPQYNQDGIHLNKDGAVLLSNDILGIIGNMPSRRKVFP